jgi:hypothetical protein
MFSRFTLALCLAFGFRNPCVARNDFGVSNLVASGPVDSDVILNVMSPWSHVRSWLIEYDAVSSPDKPEITIPVHRIVAVSAPGEVYELSAHYPNNPWQVDPFAQEFAIHNGDMYHGWPFNRIYSESKIDKGSIIGGSLYLDVLLTVIPAWPITDYKMPSGESAINIITPVALKSGRYRLRSETESVGGEDCIVFDNGGLDRIWVASKRGLCVMRRDRREFGSGRLLERISTKSIGEVGPGLWLPTRFQNQLFLQNSDSNKDFVEREINVTIIRCELDENVRQSIFIPEHRQGTINYDVKSNKYWQISAGGEDLLDDVVDFMRRYAGLPTRTCHRRVLFLSLSAGMVFGMVFGTLFTRKSGAERIPENCKTDAV